LRQEVSATAFHVDGDSSTGLTDPDRGQVSEQTNGYRRPSLPNVPSTVPIGEEHLR